MSRASDEGVHHQPGHLAQAGPQDTGDAGHSTPTRPPGSGDQPGPGCSAASKPVTDVLACGPPGPERRPGRSSPHAATGPGTVFEGLPAGPGWVLAGGDVVLDIAWRDGPGSRPGTDVAIRQMICGDPVVVAGWEGPGRGWPERARPAVAAVMTCIPPWSWPAARYTCSRRASGRQSL